MDQQPESAKRRFSFEPRHEIVGQRDPLEGGAEDELAGVEDERAVLVDLDQLGEVLLVLLRVDVGRRVVAEHAEVAVDVEVDRRRLHRVVAEGLDDDAPGLERFPDGDIRQDHGGEPSD